MGIPLTFEFSMPEGRMVPRRSPSAMKLIDSCLVLFVVVVVFQSARAERYDAERDIFIPGYIDAFADVDLFPTRFRPGTRRRRRSPTMRRIAGDRGSPAKRGQNKAPPRSVRSGLASRRGRRWWRRWESNPRPKRSHRGVYVRILRLSLAQEAARRRATPCASGHVGVDCAPATRASSSLLDDASPLSRRRRISVGA